MAKPKNKNNAQKKWDALKTDFLLGDYTTLSDFARTNPIEKLNEKVGNFKLQTKGWVKEKKELMSEVNATVIETIKTKKIIQTLEINQRFQGVTSQALEAIEDYLADGQFKKKLVKKETPIEGTDNFKTEFVQIDAPIVDIHNIKKVFDAIDKGSKANILLDRYIRPPDIPENSPDNLSEGVQYSDEELTTYQKWTKRLNR